MIMCFIRHNWLEWSAVIAGGDNTKYQFRRCLYCDKVVHRNMGFVSNVKADAINLALGMHTHAMITETAPVNSEMI